MRRGEEEEKRQLNSTDDPLEINKGFELMLKRNRRESPKPKTFQVRFGKMISLFRREIHFNFNLELDIKKSK
jgi:hypothetical protein